MALEIEDITDGKEYGNLFWKVAAILCKSQSHLIGTNKYVFTTNLNLIIILGSRSYT